MDENDADDSDVDGAVGGRPREDAKTDGKAVKQLKAKGQQDL